MELMETTYMVKGVRVQDPPLFLTLTELAYLIEKDVIKVEATKKRSVLLIELGKLYND